MTAFRFTLALGAILLLTLIGLIAANEHLDRKFSRPSAGDNPLVPRDRHPVSPTQLTASASQSPRVLTLPDATDQDGRAVAWSSLVGNKPLVVVFIKHGCPCNVEFAPAFHRVASSHVDAAHFVGVIDADVPVARDYVVKQSVPFRVLPDPQRKIIAHFGVERGASVALVSREGAVECLWPGCSVDMMNDLMARLARRTEVPESVVDLTGLPHALTAGCPFAR